jgi:hypothetical protein
MFGRSLLPNPQQVISMFFNAVLDLVAVPEKPRANINSGAKIRQLTRLKSPESPLIVKLAEAILQQTQLLYFLPNGGILRRDAFQYIAQRLNLQPQLMQRLWRTLMSTELPA